MSSWTVPLMARSDPSLRMFFLPYAGGNARALGSIVAQLPHWIEPFGIELPGHGSRLREPAWTDLTALATELARVIMSPVGLDFALFGHSMGASLAFELARQLEARGRVPRMLFASGRAAPHVPPRRAIHTYDDERFWEAIRAYGGTPDDTALSDDLRKLFLPILRADITACETYAPGPQARVACPVRVFCGDSDPVADLTEVSRWELHTTASFGLEIFDGGHFFVRERGLQVARAIEAELTRE